MATTLVFVGTASTLSQQLAAIQRLGLVPSGPRIVECIDHRRIAPDMQDVDSSAPGYTPGLSRKAVAS